MIYLIFDGGVLDHSTITVQESDLPVPQLNIGERSKTGILRAPGERPQDNTGRGRRRSDRGR